MAINDISFCMGTILMVLGGSLVGISIIGLLAYFASATWVLFSEKFRAICKAESMIFEYRKNRTEFMAWKGLKEMQEDGK